MSNSDIKMTEAEIEMLEAVQTNVEWNNAVTKIKAARDNKYPCDWWATMKLTGRMDRILARFGANSELKFEVFSFSKDEE